MAHSARLWNYLLGGKDNFAADREAAQQVLAFMPELVESVRYNREFLGRAVRHLAAGRWLEGSRLKPHLVPTVYFYGTQDRRDVTVAKAVIGLPATHVVDITSVIEKKKAALGCFGSQKYQGVSYNTPEYLNRRVERLEGYWGAMNASLYAEEFIARQPHQVEALPTVKVS